MCSPAAGHCADKQETCFMSRTLAVPNASRVCSLIVHKQHTVCDLSAFTNQAPAFLPPLRDCVTLMFCV